METSFTTVMDIFGASATACVAHRDWKKNPRRQAVVPIVEAHRTHALYDLTSEDIQGVVERTEHALGEVEWARVKPVKKLINWHPDFAFTHMFSYMIEQHCKVPTWQEFYEFIWHDKVGSSIGDQARKEVALQVARGVPKDVAQGAARWRVGNAYYGLLRETYVIIQLRARGLDVRCHPLADALFHADAWLGRTIISVRVANEIFTSGEDGRKTRPDEFLADADPSFRYVALELPKPTHVDRGKPYLPSRYQIADLARRLEEGADFTEGAV